MINSTISLWKIVLCLLLVALLPSCDFDRREIEVVYKNFGKEVQERQNLRFSFNKDIATAEMVGKWTDKAYASISPSISGKYKWKLPNELIFSPDNGFAPATSYRFSFTDELAKEMDWAAEQYAIGSDMAFQFHTPDLKLLEAKPFWSMGEQNEAELRLGLDFNYPVSIQTLLPRLQVMLGELPFEYTLLSQKASMHMELALNTQSFGQLDHQIITINIAAGVLDGEPKNIDTPSLTLTTDIPPQQTFRVLKAEARYNGIKPIIEVTTNQAVGSKNIQSFISISPNVEFQVETKPNGFILEGEFRPGETYELSVNEGMQGIFQTSLKQAFDQTLAFRKPTPSISFANQKAIYLSSRSKRRVGLKVVNTPKIGMSIHKIYQNNLKAFFELNGIEHGWNGAGTVGYLRQYGDPVIETVLDTEEMPEIDGLKLLSLNFKDINEIEGIYVVKVWPEYDRWNSQSQLVVISDIGLITKVMEDEVWVFTNSILTTEPITGANITLISSNNQEVASSPTNAKGFVRFKNLHRQGNFDIKSVIATRGGDFTYLDFKQSREYNFEAGQYDGYHPNKAGMSAFIYGERSIYRPGERMHYKAVVRTDNWEVPERLPVKVDIKTPSGELLQSIKQTLDADGCIEGGVSFDPYLPTGRYTVTVKTPHDVVLGSYSVSVEEFMPERIRIEARLSDNRVLLGDEVTVAGKAINLFGPPAVNRPYEIEVSAQAAEFTVPKALNEYSFKMNNLSYPRPNFKKQLKGKTDGSGRFMESFQVGKDYAYKGLLRGRALITLFDENGRSINRRLNFDLATQPAFFGMKKMAYYLNSNTPIRIPMVAVSPEGKVYKEKAARVEVVRYEWQNLLQRGRGGALSYKSVRKKVLVESQEVQMKGLEYSYHLLPEKSGEYEVRIFEPGTDQFYTKQNFYIYNGQYGASNTFEANQEGDITIETTEKKYKIGDKAKVIFKLPFAGTLLITLEQNHIIDRYEPISVEDGLYTIDVPITEEMLPNMHVVATLIKPLSNKTIPLTVAHGALSIQVEKPSTHIPLDIIAVDKSRSQVEQTIKVKLKQPRQGVAVTIAVTDQGINQIQGYQTPDPHGFFFQKRGLGVSSFDIYDRVLPIYQKKQESFGAGYYARNASSMLRLNTANRRVNNVSFWSGTLKTNEQGEVEYSLKIPSFSGQLRIDAVAIDGGSFGHANAFTTVADPVVLSTGLPRFATPGDRLEVPVMLANTTEKPISLTASLQASGALETGTIEPQSVTIPPNSSQTVYFTAQAGNAVGSGEVVVTANAKGEVYRQITELGVRPATSLINTHETGILMGGSTTKLDLAQSYIPQTLTGKLVLSKLPLLSLSPYLENLTEYPHGCLEQTISKAFPQLYVATLNEALKRGNPDAKQLTYHIQETITKLVALQNMNGGLSYWPNGYTHEWSSIYAFHFLTEAKKQGHVVPDYMYRQLKRHIVALVRNIELEEEEYYNEEGSIVKRKAIPYTIAYGIYTLALAGSPEKAAMNFCLSKSEALSIHSRYLVACAYLMSGDMVSYQQIIPQDFDYERPVTLLDKDFRSPIRNMALTLNALVESESKAPVIPAMARKLDNLIKQATYLSTQEQAFAVMALGKLAEGQVDKSARVQVMVEGKLVGEYEQGSLVFKSPIIGKQVELKSTGEGMVYYYWELSGLKKDQSYPQEDHGLKVRKQFFDRNGKPLNPTSLSQYDLVVVQVSVQAENNAVVPNVAITDLLPAGWEIENPRIKEVPGMEWVTDASRPDYANFRDDRVVFFTTATEKVSHFYYVVRAVSKGTYQMGPIGAEAMYDGSYHSYHGAMQVSVK